MGVIREKYGKWEDAPLVYTLFMLRFPKQVQLSKDEDARPIIIDVQSKIKNEFPISETKLDQGIAFTQNPEGQSFSTFTEPEYHFVSPDRATGVVLKSDRLVVHTTNYQSFPEFEKCLRDVVTQVVNTLDIRVFSAFGLRYIDAIQEDAPVEAINPSLHPFKLGIEKVEHALSQCVNLYNTPFGKLIFKSYYSLNGEANAIIPPDLAALASKLKQTRVLGTGPSVLLDYDHNYTVADNAVEQLDIESLFDRLGQMHDISSEAFVKTIDEKYIGNWK